MLGAVGHDVVRENHIGDWGRPFGMLIEHLVDVGPERADALGLGDLDAFYKEANRKFEDDGDFQERARRPGRAAAAARTRRRSPCGRSSSPRARDHWNDVYGKLGVLLTDDDLAGEWRYEALMPEVIERLRRGRAARGVRRRRGRVPARASRTARASRCR